MWILLILLAILTSSSITIWQGANRAWDFYSDTFRWREDEYEKVARLRAGTSLEKIKETLGSPLFIRASNDAVLTESTFQLRDYWVQTISDETGTVKLLSVTSCSQDFKPEIETPYGRIVLNESFFTALGSQPHTLKYFLSGATANSFFYDVYYGGNPGYYKTYILGIDDACPWVANYAVELAQQGEPPFTNPTYYDGVVFSPDDRIVAAFRSNSIINTYAETDVFADLEHLLDSFQIGVDRILIRTVR